MFFQFHIHMFQRNLFVKVDLVSFVKPKRRIWTDPYPLNFNTISMNYYPKVKDQPDELNV